MNVRGLGLPVAAALILCPPALFAQGAEGDWRARFLTEAPKAWGALKKFSEHLEGTVVVDKKFNDPKVLGQGQKVIQFLIKEGSVRFEIQEGEKKTVTAGAFNLNYFFFLEGQPGSSFAVKGIEPTPGREQRVLDKADSLVLGYVYSPWYFAGEPLAHWLQKPGFIVKKVSPEPHDGRNLVRVDYVYAPKAGFGKIPPERLAHNDPSWLLLDPDAYWAIQEHHHTGWNGESVSHHSSRLTYGDRVDGFPIHKKCEYKYVSGLKGQDVETITWEITRIAHRTASDKEFTMSSFGLPEPQLQGKGRTIGNWPWFVGAAAVLAVAGFAARRYVIRSRQAGGA